jgi:hypothetical protein
MIENLFLYYLIILFLIPVTPCITTAHSPIKPIQRSRFPRSVDPRRKVTMHSDVCVVPAMSGSHTKVKSRKNLVAKV